MTLTHLTRTTALGLLLGATLARTVHADPCGMVPPIYTGPGKPIERIGVQKTYVFHHAGVETFVIRPGFQGKVDEFGMLIPFPSPPAIRKVDDNIFGHVAAAVDPPEVVVDAREPRFAGASGRAFAADVVMESSLALRRDQVTVLSEEAVGMYEVAVLEAGSARALAAWMNAHGYRYPDGMDDVCEDYVDEGWCFVAVKTKVGHKAAVNPQPGMREANPAMPAGSTFDGHVQAMGFRFASDQLVVPMRLSTFNGGDTRNIVYVLTDEGVRINDVDERFVVRQIDGSTLRKNLTEPLPLRLIGGNMNNIPARRLRSLPQERDASVVNGLARELFTSDLLAAKTGSLAHPFEEEEKELLRISEALGLRGSETDAMHHEVLADARERILDGALAQLDDMTLTVIDGDFPRDVLARANLTFDRFAMKGGRNNALRYDANQQGPPPTRMGRRVRSISMNAEVPTALPTGLIALSAASILLLGTGVCAARKAWRGTALLVVTGTTLAPAAPPTHAQAATTRSAPDLDELYETALTSPRIADRGHAIIALADAPPAEEFLLSLMVRPDQPTLVHTWAAAALISHSTLEELAERSAWTSAHPALTRPFRLRAEQFLAADDTITTKELLELTQRHGFSHQLIGPMILQRGADPLIDVLTTESNQLRRLAAGYLATLAGQDPDAGIGGKVIERYVFDVDRDGVPWDGGALFVPALNWSQTDARSLGRHLIAWHVWAHRFKRADLQQQIHNNLNSIQLARAAGYQRSNTNTTAAWLKTWQEAFGRTAVEDILNEQGVTMAQMK